MAHAALNAGSVLIFNANCSHRWLARSVVWCGVVWWVWWVGVVWWASGWVDSCRSAAGFCRTHAVHTVERNSCVRVR